MNSSRLFATARHVGRVAFVVVMSLVALGFLSMGVMEVADKDQPRYWGTYTELDCEPPEFGWGTCRSIGRWVSSDGSIVKESIYLDGDVRTDGTTTASFRPEGWINDDDNNIVHAVQWSDAGFWLPWAGAAVTGIMAAWYAFRWWSRWGQRSTWSEIAEDLTRDNQERPGTPPTGTLL